MENDNIIQDIVVSIRWLVRRVQRDSFTISRRFGLTGPQGQVLRMLGVRGPLSSADLSRGLFVTPSNLTGIVDRLEQKDLVARIRKQGDRRVALITLTDAGKEMSRNLPDIIEERLIAGLSDMESERVIKIGKEIKRLRALIEGKGKEEAAMEADQAYNGF